MRVGRSGARGMQRVKHAPCAVRRREARQEALRVDEKNFSTSLTEAERLENCGINSCRLDRRVGVQEVAAQMKEEGGGGER